MHLIALMIYLSLVIMLAQYCNTGRNLLSHAPGISIYICHCCTSTPDKVRIAFPQFSSQITFDSWCPPSELESSAMSIRYGVWSFPRTFVCSYLEPVAAINRRVAANYSGAQVTILTCQSLDSIASSACLLGSLYFRCRSVI